MAIFLGHGHGDHAHNAAYIAKWTGATIYASPETCFAMQADVARMVADPNCDQWRREGRSGCAIRSTASSVVPAGSRPGQWNEGPNAGLLRAAPPSSPLHWMLQVCVLAFKHIHSGTAPVDTSFTHATLSDLGDPRYAGSGHHHADAGGHVSRRCTPP